MKTSLLSLILDIGAGDFQRGFAFRMRLLEDDRLLHSWSGNLPATPQLPICYGRWKRLYESLGQTTLIAVELAQVTNFSVIDECQAAARALKAELNNWLNHSDLRGIERQLLQRLPHKTPIQVFIQTQDPCLQRLPWQIWNLLEDCYPEAEVMLSAPAEADSRNLRLPVRILAIEGDTSGTNAQLDMQPVSSIPGTQVTFLRQPTIDILRQNLWDEAWDIFCFMGHSRSQEHTGEIALNSKDTISLTELREAMSHAADRGLKLAMFNSCDGVGIAETLAQLKIPYTIVMREQIPDTIAQRFLATFLRAFSKGETIQSAVHIARRQLKESDGQFPFGAWLPVIYQNPAAPVLKYPRAFPWRKIAQATAALSLVVGIGAVIYSQKSVNDRFGIQNEADHLQQSYDQRRSFGDKQLFKNRTDKQAKATKSAARKAFQARDYAQAANLYREARRIAPDDPESLIYQNNAQVLAQYASSNQQRGLNGPKTPFNPGALHLQLPLSNNILTLAMIIPGDKRVIISEETLSGVAQLQDEFNQRNAGGGPQLLLQLVEDDDDHRTAAEIAKSLVKDSRIVGVIGHFSSKASIAAAKIYQPGKLPMISPTSSAVQLTNPQTPLSYIFRTIPNDRMAAKQLASHLWEKIGSRKAVIYQNKNSPYSLSLADETKKAFPGEIVATHDFSYSGLDFKKSLKDAKKLGADSLILTSNASGNHWADKVLRENDRHTQLPVIAGDAVYTKNMLGDGPIGMVVAIPMARPIPNSAFAKKAKQLWQKPVRWRTMLAYDAVQALVTAAKQGHSREAIHRALSDPNFTAPGAAKPVKFLESGDRDMGVELVKVTEDPQGNRQFVPVKAGAQK